MTPISKTLIWTGFGIVLGLVLTAFQRHPRRLLGIIPLASTGLLLTTSIAIFWPAPVILVLGGIFAGMLALPLSTLVLPMPSQGGNRWQNPFLGVSAALAFAVIAALALSSILVEVDGDSFPRWPLAVAVAAGTTMAWVFLHHPALEMILELLIWPIYRIRAEGPGLDRFLRRGPLVVVCNHSSWMDPVWLGKVLPRRLFPMMTSHFYDLPGMRWLMVNIVKAIRVQASEFRRNVPEIKEAIAYLDQGRCVVIFPEGRLRRGEDKPLHPFGQGIWQILKERPNTPVITCWIEGGWGSFFSYFKGPPTKSKRFDFWRTIRIGVSEPEILKEKILEDQRETRRYLMERCLEARKHIGLELIAISAVASV